MPDEELTTEQANKKIQTLIGLPVSFPWKGYGTAIFLELGELRQGLNHQRRTHEEGEACIHIGWDWRCEAGNAVLFGSSSSRPAIERGVRTLHGSKVVGIAINGKVPELSIEFSTGLRLITAAMLPNGSEWSVRLGEGLYLNAEKGILLFGKGAQSGLTHEEEAEFEHAEETAKRWGCPVAEPKRGLCQDCIWMRPIDGDANFLDYGVCTSRESPMDGRVVNGRSGCAAFCSG
ncbi:MULTISPECIES: DUF3027 domain-containing protein [unclassified Massilia]|uniref:DUF3027 domain-containing protein n=1 Tax=unclassified Massilia TaxID=2609279 RepID=UPI001781DA15|nr:MULTISPECIES: DUF3027 domain-containing protein [unclassified Massilia]MBD8530731.1 DUF3027 domain-containing protein [Massilia sp. CFBP 13647]MBD8676457.1 DUF3027 domain-containing protein [Massilia sp. CFBP 13721]